MKRLKLKFSFIFRLQSLKEEVGVYTFAGLKEVLNFPREFTLLYIHWCQIMYNNTQELK